MKIKKLFLFFLIFSLLVLVGCSCEIKTINKTSVSQNDPTQIQDKKSIPQTYTIVIQNNKFIPRESEIKTGDTVTWINKDKIKHTITFEDVRLNQVLNPGTNITHTFTTKEEARYFCQFHPGMQGSVTIN